MPGDADHTPPDSPPSGASAPAGRPPGERAKRGWRGRGRRRRDKGGRPPLQNWPAIEVDYVQGVDVDNELRFPTQQELIEKYGVSKRALEDHCAGGNWVDKREAFKRKFAEDVRRRRLDKLVRDAEQMDNASLAVARLGISEALAGLHRLQQDRLKLERDSSGARSLVRADYLFALLRAAAEAQRIGRLALAQPTELHERAAVAAAEKGARHALYDFLDADEAKVMQDLEAKVERGEIDVTELYDKAGALFRREQERRALGPGGP